MGINQDIDLTAEQRKTVLALLERYLPNTTAWVYGSRAKWSSRPQSDLDMVVFTTLEQNSRVSNLREAFEESNLPFRVDLFVWNDVPELMQKKIEDDHVVVTTEKLSPTNLGTSRVEQENASLRDLLTYTRDGEWGTGDMNADFIPMRVIRGADFEAVSQGNLATVPTRYIEAAAAARKTLHPWDILIETAGGARNRPTGRTLLIRPRILRSAKMPVTCASFARFLRVDDNRANPEYIYWFLQYLYSIGEMEQHQVQHTGVARFQFTSFAESIRVPLPAFSQQRAIAHILGTLDDKIELNRRMNETLEEMARALFKSWFVDFLPVRAKQRARTQTGDPVRAKAALKRSSLITPPLRGSRQAKGVSPPACVSHADRQARRWGDIKRRYAPQTLQKARSLRQTRTDAEGLLWHFLRNKQLDGYKFRRQQPIGPYIADFACLSRKLLIELDGSQHAEGHTCDETRDAFLQEKGYCVMRFWNNEVFEHCFGVLERVYEALIAPPPHQPSPVGSASATPPRGGSDWSVERARAYLPAARGLAQAGLAAMDDSIAELFPDRLVDSELGEIPEGWEVKAMGDVVDVLGGTTPSTKVTEYWIGGTHCWATPKDLSNLSAPVLLDTERKITDAGLEKIGSGLLPTGTLLLSSRAPIGYLAINDTPVAINQGFIGMPPCEGVSNLFLLHWCKAFLEEIVNHGNGSTFLEISKRNFRRIPAVMPVEAVMAAFDKQACPLHERIVANERETRALAARRDALLPKLVSGELRV